ncbi:MAG: hypothetical protein COU51_01325 [Parcubacteria group bacterium CG10_big_fil_rev_8_21_14_0_10_36_14]|nr:MAG: hypothetical protein COU51_01325 [Parcubacteria group bacterium CG10_big_fil_rev_8_21_14_0_10_36_14]
MSISAGLAWATWGFVLFGISPHEAGWGIFFIFYISLLLAVSCSLAILGLIVRVWILKKDNTPHEAGKSFRQAILLGILVIGLLYLEGKGILNWWVILLFIGALTMLEFFLVSYKKSYKQ